jgi:hypothetical protein
MMAHENGRTAFRNPEKRKKQVTWMAAHQNGRGVVPVPSMEEQHAAFITKFLRKSQQQMGAPESGHAQPLAEPEPPPLPSPTPPDLQCRHCMWPLEVAVDHYECLVHRGYLLCVECESQLGTQDFHEASHPFIKHRGTTK